MRLFAYVTPSHERMFREFFEPTVEEFDLTVHRGRQDGDGRFATLGFRRAMQKKVRSIYEAIRDSQGEVILYSDVDVVFCGPARERLCELMEGYDLAASLDGTTLCAGFMAIRCQPATLALWERFDRDPEGVILGDRLSDQTLLNRHKDRVRWRGLPFEEFWNIGRACPRVWHGPREELGGIAVPDGIRVFHANYCIGVERKEWLLSRVRKIVTQSAGESRPLGP